MTEPGELLEAIRAASGPGLDGGAVRRVADGALARAAARPAPRFRGLRRGAWVAAAAILVAAAVLAARGTDAAFAVEGDPVMVERDGAWTEAVRVPLGVEIRVPHDANSVLRWIDGGTLHPRGGSVMRLALAAEDAHQVLVEFERGGGGVRGKAFVVGARDVVVERDPGGAAFSVTIALDEEARGGPLVEVDAGSARLVSRVTRETLRLGKDERAALFSVTTGGARVPRLAKLRPWTRDVAGRVARGAIAVLDADFSPLGITLVGRAEPAGLIGIEVPAAEAPSAARWVNRAAVAQVVLRAHVSASREPATYTYEKDATRVEVAVDACGAVAVTDGASPRRFADLSSFRRAEPAVAALFGEVLDD